jgi:hypothetical protein
VSSTPPVTSSSFIGPQAKQWPRNGTVIEKQGRTQSMPLWAKEKKRWKKDGVRGCRCLSEGGKINWL